MPWFRFKRRKDQHDPVAAEATTQEEAPAEETVELSPAETAESEQQTESAEAARKRRRRGSRGGRGRKRPGAAEAGEQTETAPPAQAPERKSQRAERQQDRKRQPTRRRPPKRAPLPAAKRELLISTDVGEQRAAVLEDGKVAEVYLERPDRRSIAGNIYLGVVDNVLPGMEAAFVEIGLEKNGFLYVDEIVVPELEGRRHGRKIQDLISRGEQLLVQAVKDPMKTKGARLTTEISLPGRFLVYVPNGEGLGVSRRLDDAERGRLKEILKQLDVKQGGIIVRTAAEGASAEDIERDLVFLQRLWKTIQTRAKAAKAPTLVYQEAELPLRIVRDLFAGDFVAAHIDHDRTYKRIVGYLKKTSPHMLERVHRDKEREPLFERYGVDKEIESTLSRRVDLPSGGYLVFDYAEAFTVIDVNTGRFVGSRSKSTTQRLEDTITKNNLEAVTEVVRQLRLRDIGGIIVIDFIDMANPKNRASVEEALRTELERDRTKTYVVEISPLGLVEMTRQNVTDGPREILTRKCPVCEGDGIVVSEQTTAIQVERRLRALPVPGSRTQAYRVAVHPRVLPLVAGPGGARLAAIEEATKKRFFLVAAENGHIHTDHFEVVAEGKLADLQPDVSLEDGAQLDVKLVEVGLHDPTAGVAKVAGVDVVVAGAGKLVGKKAKVVVGRVLEGQAFATLADAEPLAGAITFESEAEKPTRAPSRKRPAEPGAGDAVEDAETGTVDDAPTEAVGDAGESVEVDEETDETAEAAEPTTARKKTRRGSRGGKRRRKKPVDGAGVDAAEDGVEEPQPDDVTDADEAPVAADAEPAAVEAKPAPKPRRKRTPKIHVPDDGSAPAPDEQAPEVQAEGPADVAIDEAAEASTNGAGAENDAEARPRKKTRRGSRGGRGRKKPAPASADSGNGDAPAAAATDEAPATPADETPAAPAREEVTVAAAEGAGPDADAPEYVPMSEWLDDFDRS